ncbi:peptidoglycan-associated lipoprotein Pal [Halomonas denitrificans]|uniref:peptidoglycan-associated lipoprotein Pal n=1 Tax=Halomonas TaxID=2745 RepID=UPI001A8FB13C|nr:MULTISPECIES: peptidoglycan-associated lipoprotein Pal [Halomonas]MED5294022.1 peptidoglycan-associated lipoprotein Pal [Pseudomonadota bacterium]MBN8411222.1 peptidoglycan-associated lipoprotein Pal [Halomonas litopenaei]MBY5925844.1 peptidoglycan-associated lipoprotein Pal [Halomonas sp. DP4Y7-2]MBY5927576.1 peptidoglycan-associated lipoprotein Pal [Halomonas sp. DP8Y7-3]MBY5969664.1 peptidoglycan-associated lipoprotein Pal [Halomonas denitrificans]
MFLKPYARSLAIAASLAVLAGCSSTGGTQDGSAAGSGSGTMGGSGVGTGTAGSGQVSGYGTDGSGQMSDARIPEVRTIYFNYDSDAIRPEFESVVNAHAQYLSRNPNASVVLQGHTDERGTREYNLALGERRAGSVERYLRLQGVNPSQVEVVSYGEERPAARGSNEDAFAQNRRVVFAY